MLEATALPTVPQPLPMSLIFLTNFPSCKIPNIDQTNEPYSHC